MFEDPILISPEGVTLERAVNLLATPHPPTLTTLSLNTGVRSSPPTESQLQSQPQGEKELQGLANLNGKVCI